jgi:hypothetical protein
MCRSLSRITIAAAFVLALVLSTVPVQAQPRDFGSGFPALDTSWIEAALGWLEGLLAGGGSEPLHSTATVTIIVPPELGSMGGGCIDPSGNCRPGGGGV